MYKVSLDATQTDVDVVHVTEAQCQKAAEEFKVYEASVEATDSVAVEAVHVTIPITALEGETGGEIGPYDENQMRLSLCWDIFYRLGQLTGVPVERNTEISLWDLQCILSELKEILRAAGVQL